jgi:hypothetical protein
MEALQIQTVGAPEGVNMHHVVLFITVDGVEVKYRTSVGPDK